MILVGGRSDDPSQSLPLTLGTAEELEAVDTGTGTNLLPPLEEHRVSRSPPPPLSNFTPL